jgi:hypothetical protein
MLLAATGWGLEYYDEEGTRFVPGASTANLGDSAFTSSWSAPGYSKSYTGDINGDGSLEIVAGDGIDVAILSASGDTLRTLSNVGSLSLVDDITGDSRPEIITSDNIAWNQPRLRAWDANGNLVRTFTKVDSQNGALTGGESFSTNMNARMASDLDQDGVLELVANWGTPYDYSRGVIVFNAQTGGEKSYYDIGPFVSTLSVGNVLGDARKEIVWSAGSPSNGPIGDDGSIDFYSYIWCNDSGNNHIWRRDLDTAGYGFKDSSSALADLDNNGVLEIVGARSSHGWNEWDGDYGQLNLLNPSDGTTLSGYFRDFGNPITIGAVADLNPGGNKEILVVETNRSTQRFILHAVNSASGFSDWKTFDAGGSGTSPRVLAVNDINGDGYNEVLVSSGSTLYVLNNDLTVKWQWHRPDNPSAVIYGAIVSDVNSDGKNDILVTSGDSYGGSLQLDLLQAEGGASGQMWADFTQSVIATDGMTITHDSSFVYNSYYGQSWKMLYPGTSCFTATFQLTSVDDLTMEVRHLSSASSGAPGGGYSPVDVVVNDADADPFNETQLFLDNYDVAEHHGYSHGYETDVFTIPSSRLRTGTNTITFAFEDAPWAYTHYWIQSLRLSPGGNVGNLPDLVIGNVTYSSGSYHAGDSVAGSCDEINRGAAGIPSSSVFYGAIHLSSDKVWGNSDDIFLEEFVEDGGVDAGESWTVAGSVVIPDGTPAGQYYVCIMIDSTGAIDESDENNNMYWSSTPDIIVLSDIVHTGDVSGRRTSGIYGWNYNFGISLSEGAQVTLTLDIEFTGDDPGDALRQQWIDGIERVWSNQYFLVDGTAHIPIIMDANVVTSGADQVVTVHSGTGRTNMTNWYTDRPAGWSNDWQDEIAAHEAGHMLGLYDEYLGGAVDPATNLIDDTAIMGPNVEQVYERYFTQILNWAEGRTGHDMSLMASPSAPLMQSTPASFAQAEGEQAETWDTLGSGDFNHDGTIDLLLRNTSTGALVAWLMNNGTYLSSSAIGGANPAEWDVAGIGDFNADGTDDILWLNRNTGLVGNWEIRNGAYYAWHSMAGADPAAWTLSGIGDFNGDGADDILWANKNTGLVGNWEIRDGTYYAWHSIAGADPAAWTLSGIGDFNGDGTDDILWANRNTGLVGNWEIRDGTYYAWHSIAGADPVAWTLSGVGDFNGDGTADILWANKNTGLVGNWEIRNGTYFAWHSTAGANSLWSLSGAGDFNGDGTDDILWTHKTTGLLGNWRIADSAYSGWYAINSLPV